MKNGRRPTGIIRTLPWFGAEDSKHNDTEKGKAYLRMIRAIKAIEAGKLDYFYVAMAQQPTQDVLHCYLLVGGKVRVRCNISGYIAGDQLGEVTCWDDSERRANWWAMLTGPVSWPPEEIKMRGFQGFRYTEDLW
jgi:hypothetical protein